jgi:hypothetical protein
VFPVLRAGGKYETDYLLGTSFARPLIAKHMIAVAEREGADAVAHGATGKGNDQVRFELTAYALKPDVKVIAPWREWDLKGREDCIAYAHQHGIDPGVTKREAVLDGRQPVPHQLRGRGPRGPVERAAPRHVAPDRRPGGGARHPQVVEIAFEHGNPVAIDGERLDPVALLTRANAIAGARRRPRRPGREPLRRHEVARLLRDARRHAAVRRPQGARAAHPRPRGARLRDELLPRYTTPSTTASGTPRSARRCSGCSTTSSGP